MTSILRSESMMIQSSTSSVVSYSPSPQQQQQAYQIEWNTKASGKWISRTKRYIQFRYGYVNMDAIHNGKYGSDCRGQEHEIIFIWSITSGKRRIIVNGQEIYYTISKKKVEKKCNITFIMPNTNHHTIELIAHASYPILKTTSKNNFHQFDMILNGCSFFQLPHIYELGCNPMIMITMKESAPNNNMKNTPKEEYNNDGIGGLGGDDILDDKLSSYDYSIYNDDDSDDDNETWETNNSEDYSYRNIGIEKKRNIMKMETSCCSF